MPPRMKFAPAALLAAGLVLAGCNSTEPENGEDGHTPEAAELVIGDQVIEQGGTINATAGQTVRVQVRFLDGEGNEIAGIDADHHAGFVFSPEGLASAAAVEGQNFQKDVTFQPAQGSGSLTVGYGHDSAADEETFGPFIVLVEEGGGGPAQ